jgi:hypothetical protein
VLIDEPKKYSKSKKDISVWVSLLKQHFSKQYGRSRRQIHWQVYIETKAGRSIWSYAVQIMIPLNAFAAYRDIIVVVEPERIFLEPQNYRDFATKELIASLGEDALRETKLIDADGRLVANGV